MSRERHREQAVPPSGRPVGGPPGRGGEPPRRRPKRQRGARAARRARAQKDERRTPKDERERFNQRLLMAVVAVVIVAAIAIAAFGYYQTQIAPKGKTVLQVGETKFTLGHFERRLRLELTNSPALQQLGSDLPNYILSQLENEGVLLDAAATMGIEVTENDIDIEIGQRSGVAPGGDEQLFASAYRQEVRDSGLHTDEYRRMLRASLLKRAVLAKFSAEAPASAPQARMRVIVLETQEQAQEAVRRLGEGEDFAALAQELSVDETSKEAGGEIDWVIEGTMPSTIDDFVFSAEPGTVSGPLAASGYYAVVELLERQERDLSDTQKSSYANLQYQDWLNATAATLQVVFSLDEDDAQNILNDALKDIVAATAVPGGSSVP